MRSSRGFAGLWALVLVWSCAGSAHQSGGKAYGELADLPSFPAAQYPKVWIVTDDDPANAAIRSALGTQLKAEGVEVFVISTAQLHQGLKAGRVIPPDVVVLIASATLQSSRMARADQHSVRRCSPRLATGFAIGGLLGAIIATQTAPCHQQTVLERYALYETDGALVMTLRAPTGETLALKELRSVARDRRDYPSAQVLRSLIDQAAASVRGFRQHYEATLLPLDDAHSRAGHQAALAGDWTHAARHYERALKDPAVAGNRKSTALVHQNLAQTLVFQRAGTHEPLVQRALQHARMATRLDPASQRVEGWIAQRLQRLQYAAARQKEQAAKVLATLAAKSQPPVPVAVAQPAAPAAPTAPAKVAEPAVPADTSAGAKTE